jgi:hypothetical protein
MSVEYDVWESQEDSMKMVEFDLSDFMQRVSTETKDKAKEKGLLHLDTSGTEPVIVLTDSPDKYGVLLNIYRLEDYLQKRVGGDI